MILDGKKAAEEIKEELKAQILDLKKNGIIPGLAVVLVGNDLASRIYVRNKEKVCHELGIFSKIIGFPENASGKELLALIDCLNSRQEIHGILVQLPLPGNINEQKIISAIDPKKDVDCFHPENVGKMFLDQPEFLPCTPAGIIALLKKYKIEISGKDAVIVGRSNIVGKPLAAMLINESATVTVCHSKTGSLKEKCLGADILISATGIPGLITPDMVKTGAVVIDVGISRAEEGKLVGDVDFPEVKKIASAITPVPGGVGPMTIAMLMKNTVIAVKHSHISKQLTVLK